MKHLLTFALLLVIAACQTSDPVTAVKPGDMFYRLKFNYFSEPAEYSRILVQHNRARTATNLTITGADTLTEGDYGVIEMTEGSTLVTNGLITAQNLNINGKNVAIYNKSSLTIKSSLNMNGKVTLTNKGYMSLGGLEMQGGQNGFTNNGTIDVSGNVQFTSGGSVFTNCGTLTVAQTTSIHSGEYVACSCGVLETNGLDVNGTDKVSGQGFVKVTGHANVNGHLTKSPTILYCGPESLKLGAAVPTCTNSCTSPPMPVKYRDLAIDQNEIRLFVMSNTDLDNLVIEKSADGRTWYSYKKVGSLPGYGLVRLSLIK